MIQPKEIEVEGKLYVIHKFPATAGREIVAKYLASGLPKVGDYKSNEETMLRLMSYVGVSTGDPSAPLMLTSRALVDNHVVDWEALIKIEGLVMEYNCRFFQSGRASIFFHDVAQKLPVWLSKMWTHFLRQLSPTEKPPSTS